VTKYLKDILFIMYGYDTCIGYNIYDIYLYVDKFILKIIRYDIWYMHIEKCKIIFKNIINIWLLLCESKLKYELKLSI